jgi:CBS domain-containing protein
VARWDGHEDSSKGAIVHISEVYRTPTLTCSADETLAAVAARMVDDQVGALPVVEDGRIVGIISERDITRAVAEGADPQVVPAVDYATVDVESAVLGDDTYRVAQRMLEIGVRHLPVVEDHGVVGMVSMRDLLAVEVWG